MSVKPSAPVDKAPKDSIETIAYEIAAKFSLGEPNGPARLGYHIWRYLTGSYPSLDESIREVGGAMTEDASLKEMTERIAAELKSKGFEVKREE